MRQIRNVIFERLSEDRRQALRDKEQELRILTSFMARTKQAARQSSRIRLLNRPKEAPVVISHERAMMLFGSDMTIPETV